jgi:hypothetical protein
MSILLIFCIKNSGVACSLAVSFSKVQCDYGTLTEASFINTSQTSRLLVILIKPHTCAANTVHCSALKLFAAVTALRSVVHNFSSALGIEYSLHIIGN